VLEVGALMLTLTGQPKPTGDEVALLSPSYSALAPIVDRCLQADPEDRFESAAALAAALSEVQARTAPTGARPFTELGELFGEEDAALGDPFAFAPLNNQRPSAPRRRVATATRTAPAGRAADELSDPWFIEPAVPPSL
jgi:hypothetical protein